MPPFNLLDHSILFSKPAPLTADPAQGSQLNFGRLLVSVLRPNQVVEVACTHGDLYAGFCQAVQELHLDAQCYGLALNHTKTESTINWQLEHDARYGSFSQLSQTHTEASPNQFAEGTIDLLHLDLGSELSSTRVAAWLPKLSKQGVLVLQLPNPISKEAGSWDLWNNLITQYPHFELGGLHNVGFILVGVAQAEAMQGLATLTPTQTLTLRTLLHLVGQRPAVQAASIAAPGEPRSPAETVSPFTLPARPDPQNILALEQTIREQNEYIDSLKAHIQIMTGRESELRARFLEAHSQLNDRDDALMLVTRERKIIAERDEGIAWLKGELALAEAEIKRMKATRIWQLGERYRQLRARLSGR